MFSQRPEPSAAADGALELAATVVEARDLFKQPLTAPELKPYDALLLDPPRAGAEAQIKVLARSHMPRIAYVSCDAATFARDAALLTKAGFKPGSEVALALDPAASEFFKNGKYEISGEGLSLSPAQMADYYADLVAAYVEPSGEVDATAEELIAYVKERMAGFKVPRYIRFIDEWPMSASKIQKFKLRRELMDELGLTD